MNVLFRRRFLTAALAAVAVAAAPAVHAQSTAKPKVALVMKSLANEFFLTMETGAKEYQKHNAS
ncbi:hypothetical protein, partial [Staphylococcus aureus]